MRIGNVVFSPTFAEAGFGFQPMPFASAVNGVRPQDEQSSTIH